MLGTYSNGGTVVTSGTTDWSHGLAGNDPAVVRITKNVLDRLSRITSPFDLILADPPWQTGQQAPFLAVRSRQFRYQGGQTGVLSLREGRLDPGAGIVQNPHMGGVNLGQPLGRAGEPGHDGADLAAVSQGPQGTTAV